MDDDLSRLCKRGLRLIETRTNSSFECHKRTILSQARDLCEMVPFISAHLTLTVGVVLINQHNNERAITIASLY